MVYKGGGGVDTVALGLLGRNSTVKILTTGGADIITLGANTNLNKLTINGGGGTDVLNDNFIGPKPFKTTIKNIP